MESILSGRSSHKPRWMLDVYEDFYFQSTSRPDGGDFWSENPNISTNAANTRKFTYLPKLNILSLYFDWYQSLNLSEHSKGLADIFQLSFDLMRIPRKSFNFSAGVRKYLIVWAGGVVLWLNVVLMIIILIIAISWGSGRSLGSDNGDWRWHFQITNTHILHNVPLPATHQ